MTVTAPNFVKFMFAWQYLVKNFSSDFHENPTNSLGSDTMSQLDRSFHHITGTSYFTSTPKAIIIGFTHVQDFDSGVRILTWSSTVSKSSSFTSPVSTARRGYQVILRPCHLVHASFQSLKTPRWQWHELEARREGRQLLWLIGSACSLVKFCRRNIFPYLVNGN